jgi:hypothetical protein
MSPKRIQCRLIIPVLLLLIALLGACGGNAQPVIVTIQPTATFTTEPSLTALSQAATAPTQTPFPTATRRLSSPTPGPSPTNPVAPTLSPAPATLTATRAPTLAGLSVEYFTTDSEYVTPGDNVTLFWSVRGADAVRIYRLNAEDERLYRWDVNASGSITVATRVSDRDAVRFLVEGVAADSLIDQLLLIPLRCNEFWFFEPAPDACPAESPQVSLQAEQTFEYGRMLWVEAQDRIYVIFEDGISPGWAQYPDDFAEGDPEQDDSAVAPPGLQQPIRGFGLVWRSNPRVRERLGWATSPEVPFEGMYQADSPEPSVATLYLRMRDGGIAALDADTGEWEVLPLFTEDDATP